MKKIAILTHPLHTNYGGVLQAFALQRALGRLGYDASILIHTLSCLHWRHYIREIGGALKAHLVALLRGKSCARGMPPLLREWKFRKFIKRHIAHTKLCSVKKLMKTPPAHDRWIVGSDQVWRLCYTRSLGAPFFFLGFLPEEQRRRAFAYAASFGTNCWEGDEKETAQCALLLRQFQAVSVREQSGIDICRETFGVEAVPMPDPTLLLNRSDYDRLIARDGKKGGAYLATYILDGTEEIGNMMRALGNATQLPLFNPMNTPFGTRMRLGVDRWLGFIRDANALLTDSFHGCVFAIIFHVPFVCLGNRNRGSARFETLLNTFGLEKRLLTNYDARQASQMLAHPIDWEKVEKIHEQQRQRGLEYLAARLKTERS